MKDTPAKIAVSLIAPASSSAVWNRNQARALIIEAIREPGELGPRPAPKEKLG